MYKFFFDPEADKNEGEFYDMEYRELISKFSSLVDVEKQIINTEAYKVPLHDW